MIITDHKDTFEGSPLEILTQMHEASWMNPELTLEEYFNFMCDNYYKLSGEKLEFPAINLNDKCTELFSKLAKLHVLEIQDC